MALKVGTADSTNASFEVETLRAMHTSQYVVRLIDSFMHQGPNGLHQCLVTELLGPSLNFVVADYRNSGERLASDAILRISEQVLRAIASVHEAGYGHGG